MYDEYRIAQHWTRFMWNFLSTHSNLIGQYNDYIAH